MRSLVKYAAGILAALVLPLLVLAQSQPNNSSVFPLVVTSTATPEGFTGVPSARLPTNGLWVAEPFSMVTTGQCVSGVYGGDNGGMGAMGGDYDPLEQDGNPVCGSENGPYIIVENGRQEYLPGSESVYAGFDTVTGELILNSQGESTGSVRSTMRKTYQVMGPDLILVTITMQEEGGCSMTGTYKLVLKTADELVCQGSNFSEQVLLPLSTSTPTPTADPANGDPTLYTAMEPYPSDTTCNEANTPPKFSEAHVRIESPSVAVLDYGDGQVTLYLIGIDGYQYTSGFGSNQEDITLFPADNGWYLGWMKSAGDEYCRWDTMLVRPGDLVEAAPELEPTTDTVSIGFGEVAEGAYTLKWMDEYMASLCPLDVKDKAPDFETVLVTLPKHAHRTAIMTFEGGEITLNYLEEQQMYMVMDAPYGEGNMFASLVAYEDGTVFLSYQMLFDTGDTCTRSAELVTK